MVGQSFPSHILLVVVDLAKEKMGRNARKELTAPDTVTGQEPGISKVRRDVIKNGQRWVMKEVCQTPKA